VNRTEKTSVVETLQERFRTTPHVILADYKGMTAGQATDLRRKIRVVGGTYMVLKNRLARRGSEGTSVAKIADRLKGTCGLAAHPTDPVALAKVVSDFAKDNPQLKLIACVVDAKDVYGAEGVKQLAALPGRQELRATLLALINTPATQLVRLINTPAGQVARAIDARREKLEGGAV
jgi:large subunit ribosomal protein L10